MATVVANIRPRRDPEWLAGHLADPEVIAPAYVLHQENLAVRGVQAVVHNGYVTLTGRVSWIAQKKNAEKAVAHLRGVHGVFNHIEVTPDQTRRDVHHRIAEALHRSADRDARHISVAISGLDRRGESARKLLQPPENP